MANSISYQSPTQQEEVTPLVTILETSVAKKQSTAVDSRQSPYIIDLAKSSFGGIYYPIPGSQWYVKKISSVWTLMARAAQQNPQLNPALTPVLGDTYIGAEGTTHVVGGLQVAGVLTATGGLVVDQTTIGMTGEIRIWAGVTAPTNWLFADGSAISRTTYAPLYNVIVPVLGPATITIASPGVVTFNSHNLIAGDVVTFTTTGALPTGLADSSYYSVIAAGLTANTFQLSTVEAGAAINTTGSQSGVHTLRRCPYGVPDAANFWVPTFPGRVPVGRDPGQIEFVRLGKGGGVKTHTLAASEIPSHTHTQNSHSHTQDPHSHLDDAGTYHNFGSSQFLTVAGADIFLSVNNFNSGARGNTSSTTATDQSTTAVNQTTGGGGAHNNLQPYLAVNFIIKT